MATSTHPFESTLIVLVYETYTPATSACSHLTILKRRPYADLILFHIHIFNSQSVKSHVLIVVCQRLRFKYTEKDTIFASIKMHNKNVKMLLHAVILIPVVYVTHAA